MAVNEKKVIGRRTSNLEWRDHCLMLNAGEVKRIQINRTWKYHLTLLTFEL